MLCLPEKRVRTAAETQHHTVQRLYARHGLPALDTSIVFRAQTDCVRNVSLRQLPRDAALASILANHPQQGSFECKAIMRCSFIVHRFIAS
jgi:hypothetical protein